MSNPFTPLALKPSAPTVVITGLLKPLGVTFNKSAVVSM